jgi:hypothetical protein
LFSEFFHRKDRKDRKEALSLLPALLAADLIDFVFN